MKKKNVFIAIIVLIVVVLLAYFSNFIINNSNDNKLKFTDVGGLEIEYKILALDVTEDTIDRLESILRNRLNVKNIWDIGFETVEEEGNQNIIVRLPRIEEDTVTEFLGKTAELKFTDVTGDAFLTGNDVLGAQVIYDKINEELGFKYMVQIQLSDDAANTFANVTEELATKPDGQNMMYMFLDNTLLSSPIVLERVETAAPVIVGDFTKEYADELTDLICSGALPCEIELVRSEYIAPVK
ncbi:MAG: hypothetical protein IJS47_00890 [Clostridia bacterium]|nr:hypothetical protein [Clostridia bacterium]